MGIREEVVTKSAGLSFRAGSDKRFPHLSLILLHGLGQLGQCLWMEMGHEVGEKITALLMFFSERGFALGIWFLMTKSIKFSDS